LYSSALGCAACEVFLKIVWNTQLLRDQLYIRARKAACQENARV